MMLRAYGNGGRSSNQATYWSSSSSSSASPAPDNGSRKWLNGSWKAALVPSPSSSSSAAHPDQNLDFISDPMPNKQIPSDPAPTTACSYSSILKNGLQCRNGSHSNGDVPNLIGISVSDQDSTAPEINGSDDDDECRSEIGSVVDKNCGSDVITGGAVNDQLEKRVRDFSIREAKESRERKIEREIVWPPMVIIQNTRYQQDECGKWIGMSNTELYELFKESGCRNAKNAYGPMGHRGISLLRFEDSAIGYLDAEDLHNHFLREGRGRAEWEYSRGKGIKQLHGKRILYGYLANKQDADMFYKHTKVNLKQKPSFCMTSYHLMVVEPLKKMDEDNQLLMKLKVEVADLEKTNKSLVETHSLFGKHLQEKELAIKFIRKKGMEEYEDAKQNMDYIDAYYGNIINQLREEIQKNEILLDKQNEILSTKCLARCGRLEGYEDELLSNTNFADKEIQEKIAQMEQEVAVDTNLVAREEFERERRALVEEHYRKLREFKRQHHEAEMELEKEIVAERIRLSKKYAEFQRESLNKF